MNGKVVHGSPRLPPLTWSIAVATAVIASAVQLITGQSCLWSSAFPFLGEEEKMKLN